MKKFIIVFLVMFAFGLKAQTIYTFTGQDTVVNTATVNLDFILRGAYDSAAFQVINTKVSGTVAGNTILRYSVDGTNYVTSTTVGDTLANANQTTNTKIWKIENPAYPYWRISYTGTGTMAAITTAKAHLKKK